MLLKKFQIVIDIGRLTLTLLIEANKQLNVQWL